MSNSSLPSVLQKIVENRKLKLSSEDWIAEQPELSENSMLQSIRSSSHGIIFECKSRSPSRGQLSENYQPELIASFYKDYAAGISVLTEPDYFGGDYKHLQQVRRSVKTPLLAKDFVIDTRQITHARQHGANCILLMLSVIDDDFWKEAFELATSLHMDVLTEIHNEEELERAINLNAPIIGINNRDLHSLKTDLDVTRHLAPKIPTDRIIISESGIASYQDLRSLAPLVHGFLIGTSMMQSGNTAQAIRRLIHSEVKICGLTNRDDAEAVLHAGASWGGVIFTPKSKRYVQASEVAYWINQVALPMVGVFMDQSISEITEITDSLALQAIQLHGSESIEFVKELRAKTHQNIAIWKALTGSDNSEQHPGSNELLLELDKWREAGVDRILIDKPKESVGHELDLNLFIKEQDVLIAGGIDMNSPYVQSEHRVAGLDICSGVEASPGKKDIKKLNSLFSNLEIKTRHD